MPAIFGNQHGSDHGFGRQSGFDQMLGRRRFHDPLAGPASKPGPVCDDYPVLGRDPVEPPENGSARDCSFTSAASPSTPLRKSTGFVAISTRIGPGGISIPPLMRSSAKPRATLLPRLADWRRPAPSP